MTTKITRRVQEQIYANICTGHVGRQHFSQQPLVSFANGFLLGQLIVEVHRKSNRKFISLNGIKKKISCPSWV